ncbi:MAG: hypothetical protein GY751_14100 [Bacteroidetes bacterium]|nr:hypothetical protein [Bacteroidota bacterium]
MFQDLNPLDKPTAVLEIIIMLAGAALLGFFVGWLFQKLQRDKAKADLRFTNGKLKTLQLKSDASMREQSDLTRIVADLRSRKDALFSELEAQKGKNKELEEHLAISPKDVSEEVSTLNDKISRFSAERDALQLEVKELKGKASKPGGILDLKLKINNLKEDRDALKSKLEKLTEDKSKPEKVERLKGALASAKEEKKRLRNQVETLSRNTAHKDEVLSLKAKIVKLEAEKEAIAEKLKASPVEEVTKDEITALKEELQKAKNKYKKLEDDYEELEDKLQKLPLTPFEPRELAELKLKISTLESEKTIYQERIVSLERLEPGDSEKTAGSKDSINQDSAGSTPMSKAQTILTPEDREERKRSLIASVGTATEVQKDNFSKIIGIGPFIEAKLNTIGIFTYEQISKFTEADIDHVTRLIDFFHGRIERDGWVRQAVKLIKKREEEANDDQA